MEGLAKTYHSKSVMHRCEERFFDLSKSREEGDGICRHRWRMKVDEGVKRNEPGE